MRDRKFFCQILTPYDTYWMSVHRGRKRKMSQGIQIPGYELLKKIREGGTGSTWRAHHGSLDRDVILQIFRSDGSAKDDAVIDHIVSQLKKAAAIKNAGLVKTIDVGEQEGMRYVVTELVDGHSLSEELQQQSPVLEERILQIAGQLAETLERIWHEQQLFHGNIKPDNIFLDASGRAKIAGLGFTMKSMMDDPATGQSIEMYLGTPNYMSPEQISGDKDIDFKTDIYALGGTLYHLATGHMPFSNTPGALSMNRHLKDQISNPRDVNPDISMGLSFLITKMMMKEPGNRYSSWGAVWDEAKRIGANRFSLQRGSLKGTSTVKAARMTAETAATRKEESLPARKTTPAVAKKKGAVLAKKKTPTLTKKKVHSAANKAMSVLEKAKQRQLKPRPTKPKRLPETWILLMRLKWTAVLLLWIYLAYRLLIMP